MTTVYVAGPMSGWPGHNLPVFAAAAAQLEAAGYDAVNPGCRGVIPGHTWQDYMRASLADLLTCDAVALLDGWERSKGAQLEVHVAFNLGMKIAPLGEWVAT